MPEALIQMSVSMALQTPLANALAELDKALHCDLYIPLASLKAYL